MRKLFKAEARAGRRVKTAKSKAKKQLNKRVQFGGVGVGVGWGVVLDLPKVPRASSCIEALIHCR